MEKIDVYVNKGFSLKIGKEMCLTVELLNTNKRREEKEWYN